MIYEFTIEEISKAVVPVRADNADQAQRIFDRWYKKHGDGGSDATVYDLLDNGWQGRRITRSIGQPEYLYSPDDIMTAQKAFIGARLHWHRSAWNWRATGTSITCFRTR